MFRPFFGVMRKEFIHAFRDKNNLRMLFVLPVVQLLVMGYSVNTDVKRLQLDVYDYSQSAYSRQLVEAFKAGDYFVPVNRQLEGESVPVWKLDERFLSKDAEMAVIIPRDFSEKIAAGEPVQIGWIADGSDANAASMGLGYAGQIVQTFSNTITGRKPNIELRYDYLFNPDAESRYFMVPGIAATLLTMLTLMMTSMAIVREHELGTLEQVMVTPISTITFMMGKITAFAILSMVVMGMTLQVGLWWFDIPFAGSHLLLFALTLLYLVSTLGLGMFVSTVTHTQQEAMFLAWFFSIFTLLTSGYFTPIANMPDWLQQVTLINPMRYYIDVMRGIVMKGAGIADLYRSIIGMAIFGSVIFVFSALRFHKRTA
jgi:ABC-2 type transport system permease protein